MLSLRDQGSYSLPLLIAPVSGDFHRLEIALCCFVRDLWPFVKGIAPLMPLVNVCLWPCLQGIAHLHVSLTDYCLYRFRGGSRSSQIFSLCAHSLSLQILADYSTAFLAGVAPLRFSSMCFVAPLADPC
jgi:hypothetical protein